MASIHDLRDDEFEQRVLEADSPVLVEFWAAWCGPCRQFAPVLGAVLEEFKTRLRWLKVDTDESVKLPEQCDVSSIPTLILFARGKEIRRFVGKQEATELRQGLNQALIAAENL